MNSANDKLSTPFRRGHLALNIRLPLLLGACAFRAQPVEACLRRLPDTASHATRATSPPKYRGLSRLARPEWRAFFFAANDKPPPLSATGTQHRRLIHRPINRRREVHRQNISSSMRSHPSCHSMAGHRTTTGRRQASIARVTVAICAAGTPTRCEDDRQPRARTV